MATPLALTIVMPVYNEEAALPSVIAEWTSMLDRCQADYEFLVLDDGSTDDTLAVLEELTDHLAAVRVVSHANMGHGPTILRGYAESSGRWVFQTDSDGELPAAAFPAIWRSRDAAQFHLGTRHGRVSPLPRRIISATSRATVRTLFGTGLHDVNSPYRLMDGNWLRERVTTIPADTFAPNVLLTGLALRDGLRVRETPVPHTCRQTGTVSITKLKLWKSAARSFAQTTRYVYENRSS